MTIEYQSWNESIFMVNGVDLDSLGDELDQLEQAYTAVFIEGKSYRQAAKELAVTATTVKNRAYKYREILKHLRSENDKEDFVTQFEQQLFRALQQADRVITKTEEKNQVLAMVGAINAKSTVLDKLMKLWGVEAPKEDKNKVEGTLTIVWGDDSTETAAEDSPTV